MASSFRGILDINTQVRQLSIISALVRSLGTEALSERALLQRLYRWARLPEAKSYFAGKTGKIIDYDKDENRPAAAKRYLQFALSTGLIIQVTGIYRNTQSGRILLPFLEHAGSVEINDAERVFLAYILLELDLDIFATVLAQLYENPDQYITTYQRTFQARYIQTLNTRIGTTQDYYIRQNFLVKRYFIEKEWKKPEKYAEHIVPPRINWLLELRLAQINNNSSPRRPRYALTPQGQCWGKCVLTAVQAPSNDFPDNWLDRYFFSLCQQCQWPRSSIKSDQEFHLSRLSHHINQAINIHRKALVKRIPLRQITLHAAIAALVKDGLTFNLNDIICLMQRDLPSLSGHIQKKYIVKMAARRNESYVVVV